MLWRIGALRHARVAALLVNGQRVHHVLQMQLVLRGGALLGAYAGRVVEHGVVDDELAALRFDLEAGVLALGRLLLVLALERHYALDGHRIEQVERVVVAALLQSTQAFALLLAAAAAATDLLLLLAIVVVLIARIVARIPQNIFHSDHRRK